MATYSGAVLSGSTNGKPIPVAATATPGTTIHTVGATGYEEIFLFASNVTGVAATLTIEWGGTTAPGDLMTSAYSIAPNSLPTPIALGQRLSGSLVVKAFSGTASAINITGYVNKVQ